MSATVYGATIAAGLIFLNWRSSILFEYLRNVGYNWAIAAAITYGDLIEASFDLYRHLLYESLRWNLPADPNEEHRVGQQLTEYLWRGF